MTKFLIRNYFFNRKLLALGISQFKQRFVLCATRTCRDISHQLYSSFQREGAFFSQRSYPPSLSAISSFLLVLFQVGFFLFVFWFFWGFLFYGFLRGKKKGAPLILTAFLITFVPATPTQDFLSVFSPCFSICFFIHTAFNPTSLFAAVSLCFIHIILFLPVFAFTAV